MAKLMDNIVDGVLKGEVTIGEKRSKDGRRHEGIPYSIKVQARPTGWTETDYHAYIGGMALEGGKAAAEKSNLLKSSKLTDEQKLAKTLAEMARLTGTDVAALKAKLFGKATK